MEFENFEVMNCGCIMGDIEKAEFLIGTVDDIGDIINYLELRP